MKNNFKSEIMKHMKNKSNFVKVSKYTCWCMLMMFLMVLTPMRAQTSRSISGQVVDELGEAIIGANVMMGPDCYILGANHETKRIDIPMIQQGFCKPKQTMIEDDVWIGGNSCINQGITIGTHCVIASGSVVTKSVPSYSVVGGNPARILKQYDFEKKEWVKVNKK